MLHAECMYKPEEAEQSVRNVSLNMMPTFLASECPTEFAKDYANTCNEFRKYIKLVPKFSNIYSIVRTKYAKDKNDTTHTGL